MTIKKRQETSAEDAVTGDGVGQIDEKVNPAQDAMQKIVDKAEEQGFYGVKIDDTPNENYTLQGVTSGKPTPETQRPQA